MTYSLGMMTIHKLCQEFCCQCVGLFPLACETDALYLHRRDDAKLLTSLAPTSPKFLQIAIVFHAYGFDALPGLQAFRKISPRIQGVFSRPAHIHCALCCLK